MGEVTGADPTGGQVPSEVLAPAPTMTVKVRWRRVLYLSLFVLLLAALSRIAGPTVASIVGVGALLGLLLWTMPSGLRPGPPSKSGADATWVGGTWDGGTVDCGDVGGDGGDC